MVFLPSRIKLPEDGTSPHDDLFSRGPRAIIDLLDTVGNVRDGDHLQCVTFLAQEFGLLTEPHFLFGSVGPEPRRPHSLLLEGHFIALLRDGIVDLDGAGRLRLRRDLFAIPASGRVGRRLAALGSLSPREAAIFAGAVLRLTNEGKHAGSARHDATFDDTVSSVAGADAEGPAIDVEAICAVRRRLLRPEPVVLTLT